MSYTLTVEDAAARLVELISELKPGEEIKLTSHDRPVARIVPEPEQEPGPRRGFGACKGMLVENPDVPEDAYLEDFKDYM